MAFRCKLCRYECNSRKTVRKHIREEHKIKNAGKAVGGKRMASEITKCHEYFDW